MIKELKIISGKHRCGKEMDMRITDVKDNNQKIISWIVYGVCKRCKTVLMSNLFLQSEEPIQGQDFIIDYNEICKESLSKPF